MMICGVAVGSSHGRSGLGFCWLAIIARNPRHEAALLIVSRRGRFSPVRREEWALNDTCANHAAFPHQFAVQVYVRPDGAADRKMRRVDHCKRNITLACRRPCSRCNTADFLPPSPVALQQRVMRWLVAIDVQSNELSRWPASLLFHQCTTAGEIRLMEVDEPFEPQLQR